MPGDLQMTGFLATPGLDGTDNGSPGLSMSGLKVSNPILPSLLHIDVSLRRIGLTKLVFNITTNHGLLGKILNRMQK
jgi:hypothetical protein